MKSKTVVKKYNTGEFQRYEIISDFSFSDIEFKYGKISPKVIRQMARLYETNIISKCKENYGTIVLFNAINDDFDYLDHNTEYGYIFEKQSLVKYYLNKFVKDKIITIEGGKLVFKDPKLNIICNKLIQEEYMQIIYGMKDSISFYSISDKMGFISDNEQKSTYINSSFFLMDPTDCDSPYDVHGTPYGLMLKDGKISSPPLNHRESLLVNTDGKVEIKHIEPSSLKYIIDGNEYKVNHNLKIYDRPQYKITPKNNGTDIVLVNNEIVAINFCGETVVPMAGFVLAIEDKISIKDTKVIIEGLDANIFGIQVGPSMIENGIMVDKLNCPFFDISKDIVPFPPTVYPLNFNTARAARIAIGIDKNNDVVILWAEGCSKLGYKQGHESCGVSLLELAEFSRENEFKYIVNLDGGGSSQISHNGKRNLLIADRNIETNTESERPVPSILVIR